MDTKFFKKGLLITLGLVIIIVLIAWRNNKPSEAPTIRLGIQTQPTIALVKVAADKGFFTDEGINVEISEFTAGKFALQALLGNSLDLITPAEFPITLATINGEKLSILASINETAGGFPMVLRKEGETFDPQTYFSKKRKIATSVGGGPEFFTADFFKKNNIDSSQYEVISMQPQDMPTALANGNVDGIAIFEPFSNFAIQKTGADEVFIIKDKDLYSETIVLVGKTDYISKNEIIVTKFLSALKKSEKFIKENPNQAIEIMSAFTKLDKDTLKSIWPTFTLHLSLNNNLISTMEKEAQWAKDTGKVKPETILPNFQDIIFDSPLKKVSPSL